MKKSKLSKSDSGIAVPEDEEEGPLTPLESVLIKSPSPTNSSRWGYSLLVYVIGQLIVYIHNTYLTNNLLVQL